MDKKEIEYLQEYFLTQQCFRDYLLFRLLIEFDIKQADILEIKIGQIRGRRTLTYNDVVFPIDKGLQQDILRFTEFIHDDDGFLFQDRNGSVISRTQAWRLIKKGLKALGFDDSISIDELREIWKG